MTKKQIQMTAGIRLALRKLYEFQKYGSVGMVKDAINYLEAAAEVIPEAALQVKRLKTEFKTRRGMRT